MKKSEKLLEICRKFHIALLYAFGSQRDNAIKILNFEKVDIHDPLTDIDIGVVFEIDIEKIKDRRKLYSNLYNEIFEIFKPYSLDLVFLQECHSLLQMEAIEGYCIYKISEEFKENYEMRILRKYADVKYLFDRYFEEALEEY